MDAPRRSLILKAADRLLRHYGPAKTTIADVAKEAGVGVGSVYLEFPSKEAIVEELSRTRYRAVLDAMAAAARAEEARDTCCERVAKVFDARLAAFYGLLDEGTHACDLVRCTTGPPSNTPKGPPAAAVKAAADAFFAEELGLITELLRSGSAAGETCADDPEGAARAVLAAYTSFSVPAILGRDREVVRRELALVHKLVRFGLAKR